MWFNNDSKSLSSYIYDFMHSIITTAQNIFLCYCVANTLEPSRTKRVLIDISWYGLELYTIAEMNIKKQINKYTDFIEKRYPWLSVKSWKKIPKKPTIMYLNKDGDIIENDTKDQNILYIVTKDSKSNYYSVVDYSLDNLDSPKEVSLSNQDADDKTHKKADANVDTKADANVDTKADANVDTKADANVDTKADANVDEKADANDHKDENQTSNTDNNSSPTTFIKRFKHLKNMFDNKRLNYTLLVCNIENIVDNTKWFIKLSNKKPDGYNFYLNGNILLSRPFLLYFIKNHYNNNNKKDLLNVVESGKYCINMLDNRAKPITWFGSSKAIELHTNGPLVIETNNTKNVNNTDYERKPRLSIDKELGVELETNKFDISILDGIQ
jgi:hypothetical protein